MSLCTGGGTKKSIRWSQADILATLGVADKGKILLFEFIFFDIKNPSLIFPATFRAYTARPAAQPRTSDYDLKRRFFSEGGD